MQLGTVAIQGALEKAGVSPDDVDAVIMGQVLQAGAGQIPAKQSAVAAGIPWRVPATTVNKVCLSGLVAITEPPRCIRLGEASVVVAGGQESMTNAPLPAARRARGLPYGTVELLDHAAARRPDRCVRPRTPWVRRTERFNARDGTSRAEQDDYRRRVARARAQARRPGVFDDEIVPVEVPQRKGDPIIVAADEGVRPDSTAEVARQAAPGVQRRRHDHRGQLVAALRRRRRGGRRRAANGPNRAASPWLAVVGAPDRSPAPTTRCTRSPPTRSRRPSRRRAAQPPTSISSRSTRPSRPCRSQSMRDLGIESDVVNVHGGAIAVGHPIGASGARLALHAGARAPRRGGGARRPRSAAAAARARRCCSRAEHPHPPARARNGLSGRRPSADGACSPAMRSPRPMWQHDATGAPRARGGRTMSETQDAHPEASARPPLDHRLRRMVGRDPDEHEPHCDAAGAALRPHVRRRVRPGGATSSRTCSSSRTLGHRPSLGFRFAMFAISWAWINFSWFASAYDTDDWFFRVTTMVQMLGVLILALGLPAMFHSLDEGEHVDNGVMVAGYVVMRVAMVAPWLRAAQQDPARRAPRLTYVVIVSVTQVGWVVLVFVDRRCADVRVHRPP